MATNNTNGRSGSTSRPAAQLIIGTPARVLFSLTLIAGLLAVVINAAFAQDQPVDLSTPEGTPSATPAATMPRIELDLEEVNESDLGGIVTLYDNGDSTIVEFAATGAGGDHPAVIVSGVCGETSDDPVTDLEVVDDRGESTSVIDISLEDLLAEDHSIEIRMSEDDFDTVIACAFIEGEPLVDPVATPEASPDATAEATPDEDDEAVTDGDDDVDGVGGTTTDIDGTAGASTADAETLTINLVDWSDTSVTGTATLTEDGAVTQVSVTIDGPGVVGGHEVHIHNGTCTTPGTATYTLNPINASGNSESSINLTLEQLTRGSYFINIHPDEENWDDWMVCGNITGTPTTVGQVPTQPTAVPQQTGDGSVGGNTTMVTTSAQAGEFPTTVGVGDALRWPSDSRSAAIWAITTVAVTMAAAGLILRIGERSGKQARFTRLGL